MTVFRVDNVEYPSIAVPTNGIKRKFSVLDGPNAGRTLAGNMVRDIVGTYYNYVISLQSRNSSPEAGKEYDRLYEVLSAPEESHVLEVPYGRDALVFNAYVANGEDTLFRMSPEGNQWVGLSITFTAMEPQRRPGG